MTCCTYQWCPLVAIIANICMTIAIITFSSLLSCHYDCGQCCVTVVAISVFCHSHHYSIISVLTEKL